MREPENDAIRLEHIEEICDILISRSSSDSLESVKSDPIKFYGYVKLVEMIGEATYKLTKEFREQTPSIPWKMMEGMRHVLVHDYYHISADKLWETVKHDIPELKRLISEIKA